MQRFFCNVIPSRRTLISALAISQFFLENGMVLAANSTDAITNSTDNITNSTYPSQGADDRRPWGLGVCGFLVFMACFTISCRRSDTELPYDSLESNEIKSGQQRNEA